VVIKAYFTLPNGTNDWSNIWISFSIYAAIIAVLFAFMFKHKHDSTKLQEISH
jgi:NHS family xanthosine MFS transporter